MARLEKKARRADLGKSMRPKYYQLPATIASIVDGFFAVHFAFGLWLFPTVAQPRPLPSDEMKKLICR